MVVAILIVANSIELQNIVYAICFGFGMNSSSSMRSWESILKMSLASFVWMMLTLSWGIIDSKSLGIAFDTAHRQRIDKPIECIYILAVRYVLWGICIVLKTVEFIIHIPFSILFNRVPQSDKKQTIEIKQKLWNIVVEMASCKYFSLWTFQVLLHSILCFVW